MFFKYRVGYTPARFESQLVILIEMSDCVVRKKKCEAAGRIEYVAADATGENRLRGRRPSFIYCALYIILTR